MKDKIKELLAVLDLSEEEQQRETLANLGYKEILFSCASLADLAFRLRDEAISIDRWRYSETVRDICQKVNSPKADNCSCFDAAMWLENEGHPIHWIVAALVTKELAKEKEREVKCENIS